MSGRLFYLGHYFADIHHEANPSHLARLLGFEFVDDLLMPLGVTERLDCQRQAEEREPRYYVPCVPESGTAHPILDGVSRLVMQSSCSLKKLSAKFEARAKASECSQVEALGTKTAEGYIRIIHEYPQSPIRDAPVVATWTHGDGRVVAAGTWRLLTIDDADNAKLVANAIDWLSRARAEPV